MDVCLYEYFCDNAMDVLNAHSHKSKIICLLFEDTAVSTNAVADAVIYCEKKAR